MNSSELDYLKKKDDIYVYIISVVKPTINEPFISRMLKIVVS